MKRIRPIYIIIIILLCINPYNTIAQNAATILKKMDYITIAPKDKEGKVSIILIDKTGNQKVREAQLFQKGPQKKLYRYTKPESQAGIAYAFRQCDVALFACTGKTQENFNAVQGFCI